MLVRPGSEEVVELESKDSFAEFMKWEFLMEIMDSSLHCQLARNLSRAEQTPLPVVRAMPHDTLQLNHPPNPMLLAGV
jgi:hypothetical protein